MGSPNDEQPFTLLHEMEGEEAKALVIQRLQYEDPEREIMIVPIGIYTIAQVIEEVKKGSEVGKKFIKVEQLHVRDLWEGLCAGRYEIAE